MSARRGSRSSGGHGYGLVERREIIARRLGLVNCGMGGVWESCDEGGRKSLYMCLYIESAHGKPESILFVEITFSGLSIWIDFEALLVVLPLLTVRVESRQGMGENIHEGN